MRLVFSVGDRICGGAPPVDWVRNSLAAYYLPASSLASAPATDFLTLATETMVRLGHTLCFNRGRQRRRFVREIEYWQITQTEAEACDAKCFQMRRNAAGKQALHSPTGMFFIGWTLDQTLRMLLYHIKLGFQLDLYAEREYIMIYWYLDYLYGVMINCQPPETPPTDKSEKGNKKKDKKKRPGGAAQEREMHHKAVVDRALAASNQHLCRGLFRLLAGCHKHGVFVPKETPFTSLMQIFQRRFMIFMRLEQPNPLTFEHFLESSNVAPFRITQLYSAANESFRAAKASAEALLRLHLSGEMESEARRLLKTAVTNTVHLTRLTQRAVAAEQEEGESEVGQRSSSDIPGWSPDGSGRNRPFVAPQVVLDFSVHRSYLVCKPIPKP